MKIFAVDPGYGRFGWGVIQYTAKCDSPISDASLTTPSPASAKRTSPNYSLQCLAKGVLETPADRNLQERLYYLQRKIKELISDIDPDIFVMERLFFSQNSTTATGVFQAQGVFLANVGAKGGNLIELGPTTIKKALTGAGNAKKKEVMRSVCNLLQLPFPIQPDDTADALAAAITAAFQLGQSLPYTKLMEAKF